MQENGVFSQDSQYDPLAIDGRERGNAEVDLVAADGHRAMSVLRFARFGYVHVRHDLETADDRSLRGTWAAHHLM